MLFKKKEEKKIRYYDEWFITELNILDRTYYSKDGFSFFHSRMDRTTIENVLKHYNIVELDILAIENNNGDIVSCNKNNEIDLIVRDRVLKLRVKTK